MNRCTDQLTREERAFIAATAYTNIPASRQREIIDRYITLLDAPAGRREAAMRFLREHQDARAQGKI